MQPMTLPHGVTIIMQRLTDAGYHVYVVGGSVRDALRGLTPHDYDMTTDATPEEMKEVFRDMRLIETGIRHGTLTILADTIPYEVTTYRVDGDYRDHRHPDAVTFTRSLTEDLARRDFTMNAIAYHPAAGFIDPFGGMADIQAHIIRAVGDPARRFEEDALRILRGIRFASVLGYEIEACTAAAAREKKHLLTHVSAERVREEVCKLLTGENAAAVVTAYHDILACRLPLPAHLAAACLDELPADPILRLTALTDLDQEQTDALMRDLRFDNASRTRAANLAANRTRSLLPTAREVLHLLADIGEETLRDLCALRIACGKTEDERATAAHTAALVDALLAADAPYRISDLAITGSDVLASTPLRGTAVGAALQSLLSAVIDGKIENTRESLLAHLATL